MKNYLLGSLTVVIAFAAFAFTGANLSNNRPPTFIQYHFKASEPLTNARVAGAYETFTTLPSDCNEADVVPCIVKFDTQVYASLQDYLDSFTSDAQVVAAATDTREN